MTLTAGILTVTLTIKRTIGLVLVTFLIGITVLIWRGALPYVHLGEDVPLLRTPDWVPVRTDAIGGLLVRADQKDDSVLLLKRLEQPEVYRYESSSRSLAIAPSTAFEHSEGPLRDCNTQPHAIADLQISENQLWFRRRRVRAAGRLVMEFQLSPAKTHAAVMSAAGPLRISFHPFLGGGGAWGQHYHQIFSLETGGFVGGAVRLPFATAEIIIDSCWTPHERYVIYYNTRGYAIAVVWIDVATARGEP